MAKTDYDSTPRLVHKKPNYIITESDKKCMVKLRTQNKMSEEQISKQMAIPRSTVHYHLSRLIDTKALEDFKQNEADILSWNKYRLLKNLTDDKLKESKARDIAVSYGILDDHERLQRGLATSYAAIDIRALISKVEEIEQNTPENSPPPIEHNTSV